MLVRSNGVGNTVSTYLNTVNIIRKPVSLRVVHSVSRNEESTGRYFSRTKTVGVTKVSNGMTGVGSILLRGCEGNSRGTGLTVSALVVAITVRVTNLSIMYRGRVRKVILANSVKDTARPFGFRSRVGGCFGGGCPLGMVSGRSKTVNTTRVTVSICGNGRRVLNVRIGVSWLCSSFALVGAVFPPLAISGPFSFSEVVFGWLSVTVVFPSL